MNAAPHNEKINLLVNLPAGFFHAPVLEPAWKRLGALANIRRRSFNEADEMKADLSWADAVIMWGWPVLPDEVLDGAPNLRFCGHLDIVQRAARITLRRGLAVSVVRRAFSPAVSEMALGLILSALRKISLHQAAMRESRESWVEKFPDDIDADERQLARRPVGIVGFGAVGQGLAKLLAPFECDLFISDPFLPQGVENSFHARRVQLLELIENCDVVVVCAASNAGTSHLVGQKEIEAFRKSAVLVNVARAALVDTNALVERLRRNDMHAAIDVFDCEPLEADSPLRALPNAYLTPHRAGGILQSVERLISQLTDDLEAHLEGKPRAHVLTEAMLPSLDA